MSVEPNFVPSRRVLRHFLELFHCSRASLPQRQIDNVAFASDRGEDSRSAKHGSGRRANVSASLVVSAALVCGSMMRIAGQLEAER